MSILPAADETSCCAQPPDYLQHRLCLKSEHQNSKHSIDILTFWYLIFWWVKNDSDIVFYNIEILLKYDENKEPRYWFMFTEEAPLLISPPSSLWTLLFLGPQGPLVPPLSARLSVRAKKVKHLCPVPHSLLPHLLVQGRAHLLRAPLPPSTLCDQEGCGLLLIEYTYGAFCVKWDQQPVSGQCS